MKNNTFSTNYLMLGLFAFLLTIIYISCKKDQGPQNQVEDFTSLKNWYQAHKKDNPKNFVSGFKPDWENTYTSIIDGVLALEINLNKQGDVVFLQAGSNDVQKKTAALQTNIRLVLLKDIKTGAMDGCYMVLTGNENLKDLHYKKVASLNGKVMYFDMEGSFVNGFTYAGGDITNKLSKGSKAEVSNQLSLNADGSNASAKSGLDKKLMVVDVTTCNTQPIDVYVEHCGTVGVGPISNPTYSYSPTKPNQGKLMNAEDGNACVWVYAETIYQTTCEYIDPFEGGGGGYGGGGGDTSNNNNNQLPEYRCDCNCPEEDLEMIDASLNYEPKWGQLGNKQNIKYEINKVSLTLGFDNLNLKNKLSKLQDHFFADRMYTRDFQNNLIDAPNSKFVDRYIYTLERGWIDMHHFFYAAYLSESYSPLIAGIATSTAEEIQGSISSLNNSSFSYEDKPSNLAGIDFWIKYHINLDNGTLDLKTAVDNYLTLLNAKEPTEAPNFEYIPHIIDGLAPKNKNFKGLTGEELRILAKESYCKKTLQAKMNIWEAHKKFGYSAH